MSEQEEGSDVLSIAVYLQGQKSVGLYVEDEGTKFIDLEALEPLLADAGYSVDWNEIDGILRIEKPV